MDLIDKYLGEKKKKPIKKSKCCGGKVVFNNATGDNVCSVCRNPVGKNTYMSEKWAKDVKIQHTGEHEGKTVAQLKKEIAALKGKSGNKEKMGELLFALRAKTGWKKGAGATK